jgi:hypothetical protein
MRRCAPKHISLSPLMYRMPSSRMHPRTRITPAREKVPLPRGEIFPHTRDAEREISPSEGTFFYPGLFASFFTAAAPATIDDRSFCCVPFQGASVCMLVGNIYCVRGVGPLLSEGAQQQGRLITILAAAELLFI